MEANAVLHQRNTSVTSTLVTVKKLSPSNRSVCLSTEEDQLKFEQTTLALRKIYRQTSISKATTIPQCPSCDFQKSGNMKIHQKRHVKKWNQHQCPLCSYSVGTKRQLTFHLQNRHHSQTEKAAEESSNSPQNKYLHCSQCDYQTVDCKSLTFHIQMQHPLTMKPSKNESLTKSKSMGSNLNRCQHCDFMTRHKHGLRKHTEHHLKSFTLQCPKCSYSVDNLIPLTRHMRQHHRVDLKPNFTTDRKIDVNMKQLRKYKVLSSIKKIVLALFQCELCDYKTVGKRIFDEHLKFHVKKLVHQCNRCSYYSVKTAHRLVSLETSSFWPRSGEKGFSCITFAEEDGFRYQEA